MAKTRQPVKPVNTSAAAVAKQAETERQRKAASKKALREAAKPTPLDERKQANAKIEARIDEAAALERAAEYAANALKSAQEDAAATGMTVEAILADMGLDATGHPMPNHKAGTERPTYTGPMLALRERSKSGAYVKAANGNPCCSDRLAALCGAYPRETVVKGLLKALSLDFNPYAHLNPGQQSMNLRNKARTALKAGLIKHEDVDACLKTQSALAVIANAPAHS